MLPIAVTGATGALGRHLIAHLTDRPDVAVRALVHTTPLPAGIDETRVVPHRGSLLDPESLRGFVTPDAIVINLAAATAISAGEQARMAANLARACAEAGPRLVLHCSTAVVAGRAPARVVTEETPCRPSTEYERGKYDAELELERAAHGRFPLVIARPTAIFGPGLRSLRKLADDLWTRPPAVNFVRSCLLQRRPLHLVPVETVIGGLLFLATGGARAADRAGRSAPAGAVERYIISADDEPANNFGDVERHLLAVFGRRAYRPRVPVPARALAALLRLSGRPEADPLRIYDGTRLRGAGFLPPVTFEHALRRFATEYLREAGAAPDPGPP